MSVDVAERFANEAQHPGRLHGALAGVAGGSPFARERDLCATVFSRRIRRYDDARERHLLDIHLENVR